MWGLNPQSQDQELYAPPAEPARYPYLLEKSYFPLNFCRIDTEKNVKSKSKTKKML